MSSCTLTSILPQPPPTPASRYIRFPKGRERVLYVFMKKVVFVPCCHLARDLLLSNHCQPLRWGSITHHWRALGTAALSSAAYEDSCWICSMSKCWPPLIWAMAHCWGVGSCWALCPPRFSIWMLAPSHFMVPGQLQCTEGKVMAPTPLP